MFDEISFTVSRKDTAKEMISDNKKIRLKMYRYEDKYDLTIRGNKTITLNSEELEILRQFINNIYSI